MDNHDFAEGSWQLPEGDGSFFFDQWSTSPNFASGQPLVGDESALTAPWPSIPGEYYYRQDTLRAGPTHLDPYPTLGDSFFSITEADDRAVAQNVSTACNPGEASFGNTDTGMLGSAYMPAAPPHYPLQPQGQITSIATPATDVQFVSGSRPLEPTGAVSELPGTIQEPSDVAEKSGFRCDFPGCRSKTAFKRKPDLQRHMRKHTRKVTFDCPAVNCKYRGRKAFYRPDKLTAHVNAAHDEETLFACPIEGCLSHRTLLSRVLLGLHMRNHEMLPEPYYGYFQALQGCGQKRICPVGKCGKNLMRWRNHLWWDFRQEHILQHTEAERTAFGIEVAAAGFDPVNGYVICPIPNCPERLPHLDAFHHHLIGHTVADPDHFDAWKNVARWYPLSSDAKNCFPWETWYFMDEPSGLVCPTCGEQVRQGRNTHQLDLLKDPEEFKGCREQILRLCPRFASHPIFDDVMPVVQRSGCRKS